MVAKQATPSDQTSDNNITSLAVFTEREAATYLAVSPQFLRLSRHYGNRPGHGEGPPFIKLGGGRAVRYLKSDLDAWLQAHRCHPVSLPADV